MNQERNLEWVRGVNELLLKINSKTQANECILMEVVRALAEQSNDPHELLSKLFERVSARLDQIPAEYESRPSMIETRKSVSSFFAKATSAFL
jgi:hypothetical protein